MIARAAESNPTCFSATPLIDLERTFTPSYLRLARYFDNIFASTKHCAVQFKASAEHSAMTKRERLYVRNIVGTAKCYDDLSEVVGDWDASADWEEVKSRIEARLLPPTSAPSTSGDISQDIDIPATPAAALAPILTSNPPERETLDSLPETPIGTCLPDPGAVLNAPRPEFTHTRFIPPSVYGHDSATPTPSGGDSRSGAG